MTFAPLVSAPHEILRPLFADFPGLHGIIDSALEGATGQVHADNASHPRVAHVLVADFHLIAGDPGAAAAPAALDAVPAGDHLVAPDSWADLLWASGRPMQPYERFAFRSPPYWDRRSLAAMKAALAEGLILERVTADSAKAFASLNPSFVSNFRTPDDFIERGVGFGVRERGSREFVAGCSSYTVSSHSVEFEIETREDYQRRGLALVTGAALIEYCLDNGLEPCWDAAHEGSARLAERLAFAGRREYLAYRME